MQEVGKCFQAFRFCHAAVMLELSGNNCTLLCYFRIDELGEIPVSFYHQLSSEKNVQTVC